MNSSFQIKYTPKSCQPSTNLVIGDNLAYFDWWVEFSSRNVVIAGLIENSHIYCDFFFLLVCGLRCVQASKEYGHINLWLRIVDII